MLVSNFYYIACKIVKLTPTRNHINGLSGAAVEHNTEAITRQFWSHQSELSTVVTNRFRMYAPLHNSKNSYPIYLKASFKTGCFQWLGRHR